MTKISQLTDIGSGLASGDEFVIRDVSDVGTPNKKLTANGFMNYVINQASGVGFTQIAAGVGPLSRVRATSSGSTGAVVFETALSGSLLDRGRFDSSGRLLVGTSSARSNAFGQALHQVEGGGTNAFSSVTITENSVFGGALVLAKTRGAAFQVVSSGDNIGILSFQGADGSVLREAARVDAQIDGTPGANNMPGRLVFSTTASGSSTPTERLRITSTGQVRLAGAGITFNGDTAAANELDDYEEGTWTPSVGGNATYTSRGGTYTKIGRKVSVVGQIVINTLGTGSATTVSDLPFVSSALTPVYVGIFQNLAINVVFLLGTIPAATSRIDFTSIATAGGTAPNGTSVIGNGTRIDFAATYFV